MGGAGVWRKGFLWFLESEGGGGIAGGGGGVVGVAMVEKVRERGLV